MAILFQDKIISALDKSAADANLDLVIALNDASNPTYGAAYAMDGFDTVAAAYFSFRRGHNTVDLTREADKDPDAADTAVTFAERDSATINQLLDDWREKLASASTATPSALNLT